MRYGFYIIGCLFLFCSLCAQEIQDTGGAGSSPRLANRKLAQLTERMPGMDWPGRDTIMPYELLPGDKSLVVRYNHKGEVEHLGISLFSPETKGMLDKSICDFLERLFLELTLEETNENVKRKLVEYHIRLRYNGFAIGENIFSSMRKMLSELTMPVNFTIRYEKKHGLASWTLNQDRQLSVLFPMSKELIDGMDKSESDQLLYDRLSQAEVPHRFYPEESVREADLEKRGNIYLRPGSYFLIPALTSDMYYMKEAGKLIPLFSADMPGESLQSLFHTYTQGKGKRLLITHRQYGHFTPEIELPINDFLTLFEKDFDIFSAAGKNRKGEWEVMVVIRHKVLNYIHLLRAKVDDKGLMADPLLLKADFYSNIPQHYIKSLFNIKTK